MIVIDTNVLVYTIIRMPQTADARQVLASDPDWVVPPLWRFEFTSAVTTLVRAKALDEPKALSAITSADQVTSGREVSVDQVAAFRSAGKYNLSAYDGQYIALAEQLNARCVTSDSRMLRNVPGIAVSISDFIRPAPPP